VTTLLYLAPIIVVIGLVGSGRVSLIKAGFGGLIATLPVVAVAMDGRADYTAFVLTESLKGAWLAWHNVAVIFAGLLLHHVIRTAAPKAGDTRQPDATMRHRQAYFLCFVTAGVVECAIGFGVGFGIAIYGLLRLGAPVHAAVALGLISQMLVPWGALSIGTVIGAALGHLPLDPFGYTSALLMPAFGLGLLSWFWWWSHSLSFGLTVKNAVLDLLWTAALLGLLYLGNRYVSVDTAGLVATAPLLALGYLLDRQRLAIPRMLRIAAPFVLLVGVLLSTRLVAPLGEALRAYLVTHPFGDLPPFPWLYHAASMLLLTAGIYGAVMLRPAQWRSAIAATWRGGRVAMATTLIFGDGTAFLGRRHSRRAGRSMAERRWRSCPAGDADLCRRCRRAYRWQYRIEQPAAAAAGGTGSICWRIGAVGRRIAECHRQHVHALRARQGGIGLCLCRLGWRRAAGLPRHPAAGFHPAANRAADCRIALGARHRMRMVERAMTMAQTRRGLDGLAHIAPRLLDCCLKRQAESQARGDGRCECAAGAMR